MFQQSGYQHQEVNIGENFDDDDGEGADTVRGENHAKIRQKLFEKTDDKLPPHYEYKPKTKVMTFKLNDSDFIHNEPKEEKRAKTAQ